MYKKHCLRLAAGLLTVAMVSGCASQSGTSARGYEIRVRYAEVVSVERVRLPSAAPAGAIVGGFTGLMLSRRESTGRQLARGAAGAALGGLATAALEGDRLGYQYHIRYRDGSQSRFITEKGYLQAGDCVAVERGQHANIRRVATVLCSDSSDRRVEDIHRRDADLCHSAKDQLLAAKSDEEIAQASRKVNVLCEY